MSAEALPGPLGNIQQGVAAEDATEPKGLLRNRSYASLWLGQTVSAFGDRLHQIGLVALVGALTSNDLSQVALLWLSIGAPSLLFGLVAGAFVDRWDRRRLMLAIDLLRVPVVLCLPWLVQLDLVWAYVVTFVLASLTQFFQPAKQAVIPDIVPERQLMSANSLSSAADSAMDVIGYPAAGLIVAGLIHTAGREQGSDLVFYIDAATYAFSAVMIARMSVPRRAAAAVRISVRSMMQSVGEGIRVIRSAPYVLSNTLLITTAALIASSANVLSFGYAVKVTGTGAFGYSVLEGAIGLGSVVGAVAVGRWASRVSKGMLIIAGLSVLGVCVSAISLFSNLWLAAVLLTLTGIGNMAAIIPSTTLVQQRVPRQALGRVFSVRRMLTSFAIIAANLFAGVTAERFGVQVMWGVAGASLLIVAGVACLLPSTRQAD